ncbi:MAG: hypothetical protein E7398_00635 [Ruminococcaceae bacterium]|nr:hypothetical protein [Oscillospiraceae bacterium]
MYNTASKDGGGAICTQLLKQAENSTK